MKIEYYLAKLLKKARGKTVRNSTVHKTAKIHSGSDVVDSRIGRYSYCGYNTRILSADVGSFCSIAGGVFIEGAYSHPINYVSTSPVFFAEKSAVRGKFASHAGDENVPRTQIGNDVWIGQGALVKAGVRIGDGAIVGMGSVVTKDVEPYSIVAGNPSRLIRKRFDEETIERLCESKWWELPEAQLQEVAAKFNDVPGFLELVRRADEN
jgi:acetyltransferase-like isoleucine patch superfamily enzyme